MKTDTLFEEQRAFLRENKEAIFGEWKGVKIGFDLYLPVKISYVALFALRKKYTKVHEEILSERFVIEEFSDVMDALIVSEDDDFSLKESLKAEVKLNVISDYMRSIRTHKKTVYPSQVRRKEQSLNAIIERARNVIDEYFQHDEVYYQELLPSIDIYEVVVKEKGKLVDFHFGRHGFTLSGNNTTELRTFVEKEKEHYKEKLALVNDIKAKIKNLKATNALPRAFNAWLQLSVSAYTIVSRTVEDVERMTEKQAKGLDQLQTFLAKLKDMGKSFPQQFTLASDYETIVIDHLRVSTALEPTTFFQQIDEYNQIKPFIEKVVHTCQTQNVSMEATAKNGLFFLKGKVKTPSGGRIFEDIALQFRFECGKMYRLTGEEIYTPEALIFEFSEHLRQVDSRYIATIERAKEMLLSTLSETEERLFLEKNVTIIEGEQNYYALVAAQCHTNVVKIPKHLSSVDEIKALCIHPEDHSIPMFDGFASIALSVKSGDEAYVLKNSNEFRLGGIVKEKLKEAVALFEPLRHLELA